MSSTLSIVQFRVTKYPKGHMIQKGEDKADDVFNRASPNVGAVQGLHYIGTLNGQWRVYKDLLLKFPFDYEDMMYPVSEVDRFRDVTKAEIDKRANREDGSIWFLCGDHGAWEVLEEFFYYEATGYAGCGFGEHWQTAVEYEISEGLGMSLFVDSLEELHKDFLPLIEAATNKPLGDEWERVYGPSETVVVHPTLWEYSAWTSYEGEFDSSCEYAGMLDMGKLSVIPTENLGKSLTLRQNQTNPETEENA